MSFSTLKKFLSKNYSRIHGELKDYYLDQEGRIVATIETKEDGTKLITTYIDDVRGDLDSHYNKVAYSICNKIDQPTIDVLLGRNNDTIFDDGQINFYDNPELDKLTENYNSERMPQYNLGAIGSIIIVNDLPQISIGQRNIKGIQTISSQQDKPTHLCIPNYTKKKMPNNRN